MSDAVDGRISHGQTRKVTYDFIGKLKDHEWEELIRQIETILQRDFGNRARLVRVGGGPGAGGAGGGTGGGGGGSAGTGGTSGGTSGGGGGQQPSKPS